MESLEIHAFTYEQRYSLLADLTDAVTNCGGWILERNTLSQSKMEFGIEVELRAIVDLYGSIIGTGVEFTRPGHDALTGLCNHRKHLRLTTDLGSVVSLRLELTFLDDITLHSLLSANSGVA